jgi:hypothetical protein
MNFVVIVRDYFDQIRPLFYQTNEFVKQYETKAYIDFFRSFLVLFEIKIPSRIFSIITCQWRKDLIYLPILRPENQMSRANSIVFSSTPFYPSDLFPKNLDFFVNTDIINVIVPTNAFQTGFFNSFFLACPLSLAFLINIRRYWLQGFKYGLFGTRGHRFGEVTLLIRIVNGFNFLWYTNGSLIGFRLSVFLIIYFFRESSAYTTFKKPGTLQNRQLSIEKEEKYGQEKKRITIFLSHFTYAWSEQRVFFSTFSNQTFDVHSINSVISYFSTQSYVFIAYILGLFLGGLFLDFCLTLITFKAIEYLFIRFGLPPSDWKRTINNWTKRFIIACLLRSVPFYSADNLIFSSLGFFGRDTELRRQVSRSAFSYSININGRISPIFDGRYILGEDSYGRSAPDIIHEPWMVSRLAVEASRDLVDETYRTRFSNQRVDMIYLGALERKIVDWLGIRDQENIEKKNIEKKDESVLVKEPVRKGLNINVAAPIENVNSKLSRNPDVKLLKDRFNRWLRTTTVNAVHSGPNSLFALYISCSPFQALHLASFDQQFESNRTVRYSKSAELFRKRNARRSLLHRGPILIYIDFFMKTRSPLIGFFGEISTRRQQNDLYRARLILHDYITNLRRYSEINNDHLISNKQDPKFFKIVRRITWQQKVSENIFGGVRSRRNSVYSQQYVGNLHLIRRLFAISWSFSEQTIPSRLQVKEKVIRRRKIALDQRTFDEQKNIFEHEEIGKATPLKIQNNQERRQTLDPTTMNTKKVESWTWLSKKRRFPDLRVETKPLYAGWDRQRHAFILCNRYLPSEWSVRTRSNLIEKHREFSFYFQNIEKYYKERSRMEFTVWPKNFKTRRIRLHKISYNIQAPLERRANSASGTNIYTLSYDPSYWRRKDVNEREQYFIKRWLDPQSNGIRENKRGAYPIRSSQRIPFTLERRINPIYTPGIFQPSARGGLTWPGNNSFTFIPEKFYRPGQINIEQS